MLAGIVFPMLPNKHSTSVLILLSVSLNLSLNPLRGKFEITIELMHKDKDVLLKLET